MHVQQVKPRCACGCGCVRACVRACILRLLVYCACVVCVLFVLSLASIAAFALAHTLAGAPKPRLALVQLLLVEGDEDGKAKTLSSETGTEPATDVAAAPGVIGCGEWFHGVCVGVASKVHLHTHPAVFLLTCPPPSLLTPSLSYHDHRLPASRRVICSSSFAPSTQ